MFLINKQLLQTSLNINSRDLNKDIDNIILINLKKKYEGKCSEHGYIMKDSTNLINRKLGNIITINNCSYVNYIVNYNADILYPSEGDELEITVDRVNKMGVLGYIKINSEDNFEKRAGKYINTFENNKITYFSEKKIIRLKLLIKYVSNYTPKSKIKKEKESVLKYLSQQEIIGQKEQMDGVLIILVI